MPLKRYEIRNEYSLADPEVYKVADKDDPEALLEGVAMAGLVGVLRQLGDLAEFAAEIFHDLHEEVMSTAARGHGLIVRVQQLEVEFPLIERKLLSQTSHTSFLYNSNIDWHPNLHMDQTTVTQGDMPRFVMDSYEECHGPPRLFLLDKFDVAGAGACLKRFTDPSFFRVEYASSTLRKTENQWEKKTRRIKKRGLRWRNGDTPEPYPSSHAKLHQLFLEESIESGGNGPNRRIKLKKRQFTGSLFDQEGAKSYMENFLDSYPPEQKIVHEIVDPLSLTWTSNNGSESGLQIVEIGTVSPSKDSMEYEKKLNSLPEAKDITVKQSIDEFDNGKHGEVVEVLGLPWKSHNGYISSTITKVVSSEDLTDKESNSEVSVGDDVASEIDDYVDALATIESEVETDSESKKDLHHFNLRSVVVDSDESLGQQEHCSEFLYSDSVTTSSTTEDGNSCHKEKKNPPYSNCLNASIDTPLDPDAMVVAVSSIPVSNVDHKKFSDHHMKSEDIIEREHIHAGGSMADDKAGHELTEVSVISGLIKVLPVDEKAQLMENSLLSAELDEMCPYSTGSHVTPGKNGHGQADTACWSSSATVLDKNNWSDRLLNRDKAEVISSHCMDTASHPPKTSDGSINSPQPESQEVHPVCLSSIKQAKDSEMPHVVSFCSDLTQSLEQPPVSAPECPGMVNPVHDFSCVPYSLDLTTQVSSSPTSGQTELSPLVGNELQILSPELSCSGTNVTAEIAVCGSFETDGTVIDSSEDLPYREISLRYPDEKIADDSVRVGVPLSVYPLEAEVNHMKLSSDINGASPFLQFQPEGGEQHPGSDTYTDGCKGGSKAAVSVLERNASAHPEQTKVLEIFANSNDLLGNEILFSAFTKNHADDINSVKAAENDADKVSSVEKVEYVQTVVHSPRVPVNNDVDGIPLSSSTTFPEKLSLSTIKDCHQNEDEFMKSWRGGLNENVAVDLNSKLCAVSSDISPSVSPFIKPAEDVETSFQQSDLFEPKDNYLDSHSHDLLIQVLHLEAAGEAQCIDSDANSLHVHGVPSELNSQDKPVQISEEGVENEGWTDATASYNQSQPSVSNPPLHSAQQTLGSARVAMMQSNVNSDCHTPNDAIYVTQLEDRRPLARSQAFHDFGPNAMESRESLLNLEPPPLPPLPPMQWRVGRFQSSSVSLERQMVQQRVGHVQAQPVLQPAMYHTVDPVQTSRSTVYCTLAPAQPIALPATQYNLAAAQPMTLPVQLHTLAPVRPVILPDETVTIAQTCMIGEQPGSSVGCMAQEGSSLPMSTEASEGSSLCDRSSIGRNDHLLLSAPSSSGYVSLQGGFTLPMLTTVSEGSSKDNRFLFVHSADIGPHSGTDISEKHHQLTGDPSHSESVYQSQATEKNVAAEGATTNADVGAPFGLVDPRVTEPEMVSSYLQFLSPSRVHHSSAGFTVSEADRTWLSSYVGVANHAADNTNGASQKKLPRPRNPLIDEVVSIDKSKLRKVERVKHSKSGEGKSILREQMQLRKVEKVKQPVETKVSDGGSMLEQFQLRKVGKRIKPPVELKSVEREFLPEQLQLRKVGVRVKSEADPRVEETESPRVQLRKVSQRVGQEVDTKIKENESPRVHFRKVGEKTQLLAGPAEEKNSLFEQIRNKSFSLKPSVSGRPNIQGPRTNLKVAAILEKASNIRQAMAGSDEDDADSWSDC